MPRLANERTAVYTWIARPETKKRLTEQMFLAAIIAGLIKIAALLMSRKANRRNRMSNVGLMEILSVLVNSVLI